MRAYLDSNTYTLYAQDGDVIIGDILSAALGLQTLHLELKEIRIYSTVVNVETPYFRNAFLNDEEGFYGFEQYVLGNFSRGMCVTLTNNRMIVYYQDQEYYFTDRNLQIESAKIVVE